MSEAFAFISEFIQWIASFCPRPGVCRSTHGGVRFRHGKHVKEIKPGVYVWIPAFTDVKIIPIVARPIDLPSQSITTSDKKKVTISVTLTAEIDDAVKACTETDVIDNTIMDIAACAATPVIFKRTLDENLSSYPDVLKEILEEARKWLKPYGVKVRKAGITDFTEAIVFRHIGDSAGFSSTEEETEE